MRFKQHGCLLVASLYCCVSGVAFGDEQKCIEQSATIDQKLGCIEGLRFHEITDDSFRRKGERAFQMYFSQPLDHMDKHSSKFNQKLILLHRDENQPMVLQTSGYSIRGIDDTLITYMYKTNQIQVEHRFFKRSTPENKDWTKLDILQSAHDFHRISVAFHQIYHKPWVNTGASKGGMTSVFHRRFFPDDMVGTLADVAPLSYSDSDDRYVSFVENVGGTAFKNCRQKWQDLQIGLLQHREELLPLIEGSFSILGSADVALEHAVIEASYTFWQYESPYDSDRGCTAIPVNGSPQEMFDYLEQINSVSSYDDHHISAYMPYYFQAATQLGNPNYSTAHLEHLRKYPFVIGQYTPKEISYTYSNEAMMDIQQWVNATASQIIFIYGEFDPWSAGAYKVNPQSADVRKFYVERGNHSAQFHHLNENEAQQVITMLTAWFGKPPHYSLKALKNIEFLEDMEFKLRKSKAF